MHPRRSRLRDRVSASAAGLLALGLGLAACDRVPAPPPRAAARPAVPAAPSRHLEIVAVSPVAPSPPAAPVSGPRAEEFAALAEPDPRAALLASSPPGPGAAGRHLRGGLIARWAARDFTAAYAYADRLPPGVEREEMLGRLALVMADWIPTEAAAIVARDMTPGEPRAEAAVSVVHRWARTDPAGARAWASAFSPGPLRERVLREVAGAAASGGTP